MMYSHRAASFAVALGVTALLLVCSAQGGQQQSKPEAADKTKRVDLYGDPLPDGAIARLGTVRFRHAGQVGAVIFSPDGKSLASGSKDGIRLWDAATGKLVRAVQDRQEFYGISPLGFSSDGKTLAGWVSGDERRFCVWNVLTGKELLGFKLPEDVVTGDLAPDGKTLAAVHEDGHVHVLDAASGRERLRLVAPKSSIKRVFFSPDGRRLLSCSDDGTMCLWEMSKGKELLKLKARESKINSIAFSSDGKTLVSGGSWYERTGPNSGRYVGIARLWDVTTAEPVRSFQYDAKDRSVVAVALSPDGKLVASSFMDKTVHLWDAQTGKHVRMLQGFRNRMFSGHTLAFSPDGAVLASGGNEHTVYLWDVATGKLRHDPADGHEGKVFAVAVSRDGRRIVTGSHDHSVRLWDTATAKLLHLFRGESHFLSVAISPDGKTVAGGDHESMIRLWDSGSGKELGRMKSRQGEGSGKEIGTMKSLLGEVTQLAFAPDGKTLASGRWTQGRTKGKGTITGAIQIWDVATRKERSALDGPELGYYAALAFSRDGRTLLSAHEGGSVRSWQLDTGKGSLRFSPHEKGDWGPHGVAFSSDTNLLATNTHDDGRFFVWDVATGRRQLALQIKDGYGYRLEFSPDRRFLATCTSALCVVSETDDRTIRLWELASGQEVLRFDLPPANDVVGVAFAPDGSKLYTGMVDSTVLVWGLTANAAAERPDPVRREKLWADLAGPDAGRAYRAMRVLAASPAQTLLLLAKHLQPVKPADHKQLQELIAALDHKDFAVRDRASKDLDKLAELAEPHLRKALKNDLPLETRQRLERVLEPLARLVVSAPDKLRSVRAVAILEWTATAQARQLLATLATGAPEARVTQAAREALERLADREALDR